MRVSVYCVNLSYRMPACLSVPSRGTVCFNPDGLVCPDTQLIQTPSWVGCAAEPPTLWWSRWTEWKRVEGRGAVQCVWRWGVNLWKQSHDSWGGSMCEACLFCIYPPGCSCVHCPFPRTPEHNRRPLGSPSIQPLGWSTEAPCPHSQGGARCEICSALSGSCRGFGLQSETGRSRQTAVRSALPPTSLTGHEGQWMWFHFSELAMVALPEGSLQGCGFCFQNHESRCES